MSKVYVDISPNPVFDKERCKCHVVLCGTEVFKRLVNSEEESVAVVFASEGSMNNGTFTFKYEYSNFLPIQVTRQFAFELNQFILSTWDRVEEQQINQALKSQNGRMFFLTLVKKMKERNEGGSKVNSLSPAPINPGPTGNALTPPVQEQVKQVQEEEA